MNYHRYFIPLTPDSKGYEQSGKEPLGRCILEDRGKTGKLSLWVQDLKAEAAYKIVLILSEAGQYTGVSLGSLYVDGKGKGEFKSEFDLLSLANGQELSRVCAVAVMTGSGELVCPLTGYKDSPVLWKNHFTMLNGENKNRNKITPDVSAPSDKENDTARVRPVTEPTGQQPVPDKEEVCETGTPPDPGGVSVPEPNMDPLQAEETCDTQEGDYEYEPDVDEYFEYFEDGFNAYKNSDGTEEDTRLSEEEIPENIRQDEIDYEILSNLKEVFENNIDITPFEQKSADEKWVRISLREPVYLPVEYRLLMNHPLIIAAYKKFNHLILGRMADEGRTQYILGVPGIYEPQYGNAVRQMGFTQFKTVLEGKGLNPNDYGYWLAPLYMIG